MSDTSDFKEEVRRRIAANAENRDLRDATREFMRTSLMAKYSYNFEWLGRPIIQYPQDMAAVQELIWAVKPDIIIETGIAHGGSLVLSASILAMLDYADALATGEMLDPANPKRRVVGVDIEIRPHNREALERHPMRPRMELIEGSSIDPAIIERVKAHAQGRERVMVFLDSNHTHDHVLAELEAYAPLVTPDSYCVVFDTIVEDVPDEFFPDRPWGTGNNPKTAVWEFLKTHPEFEPDKVMENKLLITVAPDGFLKRIR